jgi:hypothetical protein
MKKDWKYSRLIDLTLLFLGGFVAGSLIMVMFILLWRML